MNLCVTLARKALVLQHAPHEGPARIEAALARHGATLDLLRLDLGAQVPATLTGYHLLLVMGGGMSVTDIDHPELPFLRAEVSLIQACLERHQPVLGVCLGAQLLAYAAGARVYPLTTPAGGPLKEVGWGAVHCQKSPEEEPILAGLGESFMVLHWHGDTFDLPPGARLLGSTLHCPNQFFAIDNHAYGLQFHIELERRDLADWVEADREYIEGALGPDGPRRILREAPRFLPAFHATGDRLLNSVLQSFWGP